MLDLNRWLARNSYGDVAVVSRRYSDYPDAAGMHRVDGFKVTAVDGNSNEQNLDFTVYGGLNSDGYNDLPAIMYLKGWYIFLSSDIKWSEQNDNPDDHMGSIIKEYPGETIPDPNNPSTTLAEKLKYAMRSDTYVKDVGQIQPGSVGQTDVIYVELTLDEVTDGGSSPSDSAPDLQDPGIKDPVVGNQTANRIKASVKFLVAENWTGTDPLTGAIYDDPFFAEGEYATGVKYLRAPISVLTRSHSTIFSEGDFTDILELQDKRVCPPVEITHRLRHGGYTQNDVDAGRALSSDVDETWGATGRNEGVDTEAFNSNSVTPRVLDNEGDYRIRALAVAGTGETGAAGTIQPNPDGLVPGEITSDKVFAGRLYVRAAANADSMPTVEEARSDLEDSLVVLEGRGFTGSLIEARTSADPALSNFFWTQKKDDESVVSQLDNEGKLALGKEVRGASGYQLDVADRANFDEHVDLRGGTNQFWNDVGVSGSAHIFDAQWDRQTNMYRTPVNGLGGNAYWKICEFSTDAAQATDLTFILNVAASSGSLAQPDRFGSFKIRLNKTSSGALPTFEAVALQSHNFLKENLRFSVVSSTSNSMTLQAHLYDENYGKVYSYNATDTVNVNGGSLAFYQTGTTSWTATAPLGILPAETLTYAEGHFGTLHADRMSYNTLTAAVDLQGTLFEYTIASRPLAAVSASYQSFVVVIKDPTRSNSVNASCRVKVQIPDATLGASTPALTVTDLTWTKQSPYGDFGLVKFAIGPGASTYNLNMYLSDSYIPSSAALRNLTIEVSEDPFFGGNTVAEPLVLAGREDTTTALVAGAGALVSADAYIRTVRATPMSAEPDIQQNALASTASVALRGRNAFLDMSDPDVWGLTGTGAMPSGPRIKDLSWTVGRDGQYLSAAIDGVLWRDIPIFAVDSIAELRTLDPVTLAAKAVLVKGYYASGDGSSDIFIYDATSTEDDDSGIYIAYQGDNLNPGRFVRQVRQNTLSVYDYGAIPGLSGSAPLNRDAEIAAAIAAAEQFGMDLVIPAESVYLTTADMEFPETVALTIGSGVFLYNNTTRPIWTFRGPTTINTYTALTHPVTGPILHFAPSALTEVRPEWWFALSGKDEFGVAYDNTDALNDMYSSLLADADKEPIRGSYSRGFTVVYGSLGKFGSGGPAGFYGIEGDVEMTSRSKFVGSSGIELTGSATLTVNADIVAPNYTIFTFPDVAAGTVYYCSEGPVSWGANAPSKVNVTWFGVLPGAVAGVSDKLRNLLNNFECSGVNATLYFPAGIYQLGTDGDPVMDFFENPVEQAPGALLTWYKMNVRIKYPVDSMNAKFDHTYYSPTVVSLWTDTWAPSLGGGIVRPEWFRANTLVSDTQALQMAFNCLTASTWDGDETSPDPLAESYALDSEYMWLDGGSVPYYLDGGITMLPGYKDGRTATAVSRNLGVRNLVLDYDHNTLAYPTFGYLTTSPAGTSVGSYRCSTVGLRIENCSFYGQGSTTVWSQTLSLRQTYGAVISNCNFYRSEVSLSSTGAVATAFYHGTVQWCTFENSIVQSPSNTRAKFLFNRFKVVTSSSTSNVIGAEYLLLAGAYNVSSSGYSQVMGNVFEVPNMYTVGADDFLSNALYTHNQCQVSNNTFINTKYQSYGCKELIITGNIFECNVDLGSVQKDPVVDSFIVLIPDAASATAEDTVITGNAFDVKYPLVEDNMISPYYPNGYGSPGNFAWDYIFEAISLNESSNSFNDGGVYDVIVKDNSASKLINVRSTELTETRFILGAAGYSDTYGITVPDMHTGQLPPSTANYYFGDTGRRLFGLPQNVEAFAWGSSANSGANQPTLVQVNNMVSLTHVGYTSETTSDASAPSRYRALKVLARHCVSGSSTWALGLPVGVWFHVSCKFVTYRARNATVRIPESYQASETDGAITYIRSHNTTLFGW